MEFSDYLKNWYYYIGKFSHSVILNSDNNKLNHDDGTVLIGVLNAFDVITNYDDTSTGEQEYNLSMYLDAELLLNEKLGTNIHYDYV